MFENKDKSFLTSLAIYLALYITALFFLFDSEFFLLWAGAAAISTFLIILIIKDFYTDYESLGPSKAGLNYALLTVTPLIVLAVSMFITLFYFTYENWFPLFGFFLAGLAIVLGGAIWGISAFVESISKENPQQAKRIISWLFTLFLVISVIKIVGLYWP
jgi:hypothetical protein